MLGCKLHSAKQIGEVLGTVLGFADGLEEASIVGLELFEANGLQDGDTDGMLL